jgi:hypothetical protein
MKKNRRVKKARARQGTVVSKIKVPTVESGSVTVNKVGNVQFRFHKKGSVKESKLPLNVRVSIKARDIRKLQTEIRRLNIEVRKLEAQRDDLLAEIRVQDAELCQLKTTMVNRKDRLVAMLNATGELKGKLLNLSTSLGEVAKKLGEVADVDEETALLASVEQLMNDDLSENPLVEKLEAVHVEVEAEDEDDGSVGETQLLNAAETATRNTAEIKDDEGDEDAELFATDPSTDPMAEAIEEK